MSQANPGQHDAGRPSAPSPWNWSQIAIGVFTLGLVVVGFLQWRTLESQVATQALQSEILKSQTEVQRLASQANIAPSYQGKRDDGKLIVGLKNTGLLPALEVTVAGRTGVRSPMSEPELVAFCGDPATTARPLIVHPGASIEHHADYPNFLESAEVGEEIYYVCGFVGYSDPYGEPKRSNYCFSFDRNEIGEEYDHTICRLPEAASSSSTG